MSDLATCWSLSVTVGCAVRRFPLFAVPQSQRLKMARLAEQFDEFYPVGYGAFLEKKFRCTHTQSL